MKLSDIFPLAKWTKRVLLGFVYHVHVSLISYSDFTCATDDFQKSWKNVIFENCVKICRLKKNQKFDFFGMARPVCSHLHFVLIKHLLKKHLSSKTLFFAFLTKKRGGRRNLFQNTTKLLSMY